MPNPLAATSPATTKAIPSRSISDGCSCRMLHTNSTLTMGTHRLDRLVTAVGSRSRTIDHGHHAMLDAITTL